jgi:hypothetical protein
MSDTLVGKAMGQVKKDVKPESGDHLFRLVICGLLVAAGIYATLIHPADKPWERNDLILSLGMIGAGLAIAFTGTFLAILKAIPLPWAKKEPPSA